MQRATQSRAIGSFSVVWIVLTSGGVFFNSSLALNFVLFLSGMLFFLQLFLLRKTLLSHYLAPSCFFVVVAVLVLLSLLANSDYGSWLSYVRIALMVGLAFGTSMLVSNERIITLFVKAVVVLAGVSLFFFYAEVMERGAGWFPVLDFYDHRYANAIVHLSLEGAENRNSSVFIEPGLYQIYLNIALFSLLYGWVVVKNASVYVFVLILAIYSTASTTGYIVSVLVLGGMAFSQHSLRGGGVRVALRFLAVLGVVSLVLSSNFFSETVEDKFKSEDRLSFVTRQNSTIIDIFIAAENPIFGGGAGSYKASLDSYDSSGFSVDAATNTFTQLGAILGVPVVLLMVWRTILFISQVNIGLAGKAVFFLMYVISFSTEPFVLFPFFYLLAFMSFKPNSVSGRA